MRSMNWASNLTRGQSMSHGFFPTVNVGDKLVQEKDQLMKKLTKARLTGSQELFTDLKTIKQSIKER